jgi:hypothetical protein
MLFLQCKYHANIPPKKVLNAYGSILSPAESETNLRKIHSARRDHIATAEVDVVVLQYMGIIKTSRGCKHSHELGRVDLLE